jgi:hypothetical protein
LGNHWRAGKFHDIAVGGCSCGLYGFYTMLGYKLRYQIIGN